MDSDDFAAEDLLETLYRLAEKYDAEMSICRGYDLYEGRPVPDLKQEGIESVTDSEEGLRQVMKARVFGVMPWGKLYRREIFEGVVYPEKTIAEDAYVIVPLMEHCRKVAFPQHRNTIMCTGAKASRQAVSLVRSRFGGSMGS